LRENVLLRKATIQRIPFYCSVMGRGTVSEVLSTSLVLAAGLFGDQSLTHVGRYSESLAPFIAFPWPLCAGSFFLHATRISVHSCIWYTKMWVS